MNNEFVKSHSLMVDNRGINEEKKQELRQGFNQFDSDKDGLITFIELHDLMNSLNYKTSEAELQDLVNEVEITEKGQLSFSNFLELMARKLKEVDTEEELMEAFKIFDKDNTNLISTKNLMAVFSMIDEKIKEEEILQMMKESDLDSDGYLNFDEFCRMVKNR